ncbi:MAG: PAS domain S-box protein [Planctomycetota bacterium]
MSTSNHDRTNQESGRCSGQACLLDDQGVIAWVNDAWRRCDAPIPGAHDKGDSYARACQGLADPALLGSLRRLLDGSVDHFDQEVTTSTGGETRRLQVRGQILVLDATRCALISHEDVTQARIAETALQASEERYRQFFEAAPDAVFLLSTEPGETGKILDANTLAATMHGYTRDELLQMHIGDLDAPRDAELVQQRIAQLMRDGEIHFEALHRHRDGREFPTEISARRATIAGRTCVVTFNRDISERRRYQLELAENQLRLDVAARASQIGFWEWDLTTNSVHFSPEWKAQIGYQPHEIADDFEEWRSRVHPDDLEPAMAAVQQHVEGQSSVYETRFRFRHKDGSYRWIYVRGEAVRDGDGKPLRFFGCHVDVTAQKQDEDQRVELAQRMSTLQRLEAMGTLAGGIAHDFNNILSIISGNCELALLETEAPELVESLQEIKKAGERARSLVRQILAFSRNETPVRRRVCLAQTTREAVRLVRSTTPQRVAVDSQIHEAIPAVAADPEQLHQVLVNLGTNAWHAIGDGEGHVTFQTFAGPLPPEVGGEDLERVDADYAIVEVRDDGAGMDAHTLQHIFEPFFTTKPSGQGTGLGLSVVHGIVKNHGGAIDVRSAPGQGTTFRVYLPPAAEAAAADEPATDRDPVENARVLLVDDEPKLLSVLSRGLQRFGLRITAVEDPRRALETLQDDPTQFDVVVTDLDMPGLDGIETATRVRALRADLPIVLCSGFMETEAQERALESGVTRVLGKPLLATELATAIRELLQPSPR